MRFASRRDFLASTTSFVGLSVIQPDLGSFPVSVEEVRYDGPRSLGGDTFWNKDVVYTAHEDIHLGERSYTDIDRLWNDSDAVVSAALAEGTVLKEAGMHSFTEGVFASTREWEKPPETARVVFVDADGEIHERYSSVAVNESSAVSFVE